LPSRLSQAVGEALRNRGNFVVSGNGNGHAAEQAS
jgi:hypothetical protein